MIIIYHAKKLFNLIYKFFAIFIIAAIIIFTKRKREREREKE